MDEIDVSADELICLYCGDCFPKDDEYCTDEFICDCCYDFIGGYDDDDDDDGMSAR